ncbi:MAG: hypothetical protein GEU86_01370 [Actinophytocola sp.]|nr:hypothetical protein [Actinophytocola sp.]
MGLVDADFSGRDELVEQATRALAEARQGHDDGALLHATTNVRELIMLLFGECSAMVSALGNGGATPVKVQVFDDEGTEVSIDQADPPVRTAVRTLLAQMHGNREDAQQQIEIALANAAPDEVASLVLQALRWTIRLAGECIERELTVAPWIVAALAD